MSFGGALAQAFVRLRVDSSQIAADTSKGIKEGAATGDAESAGANAGSSFGRGFNKAVKTAAIGVAIVAAIGAASIKAGVDFQSTMTKIQTQAGASKTQVQQLTGAVLKLAPSTEQGPQQLAEALYHLKSVGLDNVQAMKALKTASDLAAVGGANLEQTTNAIASAWRSGIKGAQNFGQAAATVNAIIGAGNMQMQDFVGAMGTGILSAANTFGVSLSQVGGAMALMTDEGVPAEMAATRLRMTLSLIGAPSAMAVKQLKSIGLSSTELGQAMRGPGGLVSAIGLLKQHLDDSGLSATKSAALLSRAFGGGQSSSAILTMINNFKTLKQKQDQINTGIGRFGADVKAQRQTASAQLKLLGSAFDTMGVRIGLALLPPLTHFVGYLDNTVLPKVTGFVGTALTWLKKLTGFGGSTGGQRSPLLPTPTGKALPSLTEAPPQAKQTGLSIVNSIVDSLVKSAGKIGGAIIKMFSSVDWESLGKQAAMEAVPFIIGFANNLVTALIDEAVHHPMNMLIFLLSILPAGKLLSALGDVFKGIPILGKLLSLFGGVLEKAGKPIWTLVGKLLKLAFGGVAERATGIIGDLSGTLISKGKDLISGLLKGAEDLWSRTVVSWIKSIGGKVVTAIGDTSKWLVSKGINLILGLLDGAEQRAPSLFSWVRLIPKLIKQLFADAGSWLVNAGKKIVLGLINGITSMIGKVGSAIGSVVGHLKSFLPFSPAKQGPLSGAGDPYYSGVSIAKKIAAGIVAATGDVKKAIHGTTGQMATALSEVAGQEAAGKGELAALKAHGLGNSPEAKKLRKELDELTSSAAKLQAAFNKASGGKAIADTTAVVVKATGSKNIPEMTAALAKALKQEQASGSKITGLENSKAVTEALRKNEESQIKALTAARKSEAKENTAASRKLRAEQEKQIKTIEKLRATQETQIKQTDATIKNLRAELTKLREATTKLKEALAKTTKAAKKAAGDSSGSSGDGSGSSGGADGSAASPDWGAFINWMLATENGTTPGPWQESPGPLGGFGQGIALPSGPRPVGMWGGPAPWMSGGDGAIAHLIGLRTDIRELISVAREQPQKTAAGLNAAMNGIAGHAVVRGNW